MQISSVFTRPAVHVTQTVHPNTSPTNIENKGDVFQASHSQSVRFSGIQEDLATNVNAGNKTQARKLINKQGADINAIDENGETLLTKAVTQKKHQMIRLLKELGADLDGANIRQWTPSTLAVLKNDPETMELLHQLGADLNASSPKKQNPMTTAASLGRLELIKTLHQLKVDPNAADEDNWTPLMMATGSNQPEAIKLLHSLGADLNLRHTFNMTPIELANSMNKTEAQQCLTELSKKNPTSKATEQKKVLESKKTTETDKTIKSTILDELEAENAVSIDQTGPVAICIKPKSGTKLYKNSSQNPSPENMSLWLLPGNTLEIKNKLYKVTPDLQLFKVSDNAKLVRFLFPDGIHDLYYKQNQTPACGKLTQFHALLDDPSGVGTKALLDRFTADEDKIYVHFKDYHHEFSIKNDIDSNGNCKTKPGDARGVTGPLAIQLIERAYYRGFKWSDMNMEVDDDFDDNESIATLDGSNMKKDNLTGTGFGIELLGDSEWSPVTFTLTNKNGKQLSLAESKAQSPEYAKQLEEFLSQFQQNPSIFRGRASTRLDKRGATSLQDSDKKRSLSHKHAHYFKKIELKQDNDQNTQRLFHIIDPHKVKKPYILSERDFMNNIYKISGLTPKAGGYKPQDTSG